MKFIDFLSGYPLGIPVKQTIVANAATLGWTDYCPYVGRWKTARWDSGFFMRTKSYRVYGHGFCAGRCGAGCPWFGEAQVTADCLHHDACAHVEGEQFGGCGDEWTAASDDF